MIKKILNLGCGKGQNIPYLQKKGDLYCADINADFVEKAKIKYPKCKYYVVSAETLGFENNFFDEIYCYDVLEHVDNLDLVLTNIFNILKKDGLLYVEVLYDKSEEMLVNTRKTCLDEIGHKRIFRYKSISKYFMNFDIIGIRKTRGIVNLYLWLLFKLNIGLADQMATVSGKDKVISRLLSLVTIWFDRNLFNTLSKYIPFWIFTIPFGDFISFVFPKIVYLKLRKLE